MGDGVWATCPACGAIVGAATVCPVCALDLVGLDAARIRDLAEQLAELDRELIDVSGRRQSVAYELQRLKFAASATASRMGPAAPRME
jgi:hypothetical protein